MKPPPRSCKNAPRNPSPTPKPRNTKRACTWSKKEQKLLLKALKEQRSGPLADVDYNLLQKAVPSRSVSEIQSVFKRLRDKVISSALSQIRLFITAEKVGVPIEKWSGLARAVSGSHESPLSKAFSQMWVVASTEPLTIQNRPQSRLDATSTTPDQVTPSTSVANEAATSSQVVPAEKSDLIASTSCTAEDLVVNFERIYNYLSAVHNPESKFELTAMESAVVLDLVMSLPEELDLLQCQSLHRHLIQTYQNLSKREDSDEAQEAMMQLKKQRREHNQAPPVEPTWTGLCPPLNPFMMPLELLKRS
ncbi:snRNA-activating protein complex subunit 2 [Corythoichthys intestinalis]|uniref:snRNA-activating protein complex subunit 2 n=1 Tax=Corythoichthys intestinalis TaxID=161448 RepID=UPI0025A62AC3|nr:snRNA-activating protein complex subunit 2 [Corythoichthys intestinalis]